MKEVWVGYNVGCTVGFHLGHSAWQIDQFPTCWPMNGLFVHWSRGWGVSSFSERLVYDTFSWWRHKVWIHWWHCDDTISGLFLNWLQRARYNWCCPEVCCFFLKSTLTLNIWNCFRYCLQKMYVYSHFVSYLGFCSTEEDMYQIYNVATLHVACIILLIPCLLIHWRLKEPGHQKVWYWLRKARIFHL